MTDELRTVLVNRRMLGGVLMHEEPFLSAYAPLYGAGDEWPFAMGGTEGRARSVLMIQNQAAYRARPHTFPLRRLSAIR